MAERVPFFGGFREVAECHFLNLVCHAGNAIQDAAWEWWAEVSPLSKILMVGGVVLAVIAIIAIIKPALWLLHKVGGWPAVAGAVLAVLGLVLAFVPKPRSEVKPDFEFGVERTRPRRTTIFDRLRNLRNRK